MSDTLRIALKGSGEVRVSIQQGNNKDFFLEAIEDWARLTSVQRAVIKAEELEAAEDPDTLIWEVLQKLVQECHINREVRKQIDALAPIPNDPLSKEQLREMQGDPAWCKELQCWGIVKCEPTGRWANKPFLIGVWCHPDYKTAVNFEYDIEAQELTLYRRKPENQP